MRDNCRVLQYNAAEGGRASLQGVHLKPALRSSNNGNMASFSRREVEGGDLFRLPQLASYFLTPFFFSPWMHCKLLEKITIPSLTRSQSPETHFPAVRGIADCKNPPAGGNYRSHRYQHRWQATRPPNLKKFQKSKKRKKACKKSSHPKTSACAYP